MDDPHPPSSAREDAVHPGNMSAQRWIFAVLPLLSLCSLGAWRSLQGDDVGFLLLGLAGVAIGLGAVALGNVVVCSDHAELSEATLTVMGDAIYRDVDALRDILREIDDPQRLEPPLVMRPGVLEAEATYLTMPTPVPMSNTSHVAREHPTLKGLICSDCSRENRSRWAADRFNQSVVHLEYLWWTLVRDDFDTARSKDDGCRIWDCGCLC